MDEKTLEAVTRELQEVLPGHRMGRIFPLSRRQAVIDFRLPDSLYLFISIEPNSPRTYLIRRRLKDLERSSVNLSPFYLLVKKYLGGAELISVKKLSDDRILVLEFAVEDDLGAVGRRSFVLQLTGRSANIFLLDQNAVIVDSQIPLDRDGQRPGDTYRPPASLQAKRKPAAMDEVTAETSISEALDKQDLEREAEQRFRARAAAARSRLDQELDRRQVLKDRLKNDLIRHGDADRWKRYGDLILANLSTADRKGTMVELIDLFDPATPRIKIEVDENLSLTDAAAEFFKRYTKARNAAVEIQKRIETLEREILRINSERERLEVAINAKDDRYFASGEAAEDKAKRPSTKKADFSGARRFRSSDGFEILVGKKAVDNDQLTFRVAGPLDLWLHAADYAGSHVIVRNPNRSDIPHKTLIEAASLAAFYSSGKSQTKAAVHYTQKKFVNKPRGAKPGLVRLASFKTILVQPEIPAALDQNEGRKNV